VVISVRSAMLKSVEKIKSDEEAKKEERIGLTEKRVFVT
jgi:hypothetical protein